MNRKEYDGKVGDLLKVSLILTTMEKEANSVLLELLKDYVDNQTISDNKVDAFHELINEYERIIKNLYQTFEAINPPKDYENVQNLFLEYMKYEMLMHISWREGVKVLSDDEDLCSKLLYESRDFGRKASSSYAIACELFMKTSGRR